MGGAFPAVDHGPSSAGRAERDGRFRSGGGRCGLARADYCSPNLNSTFPALADCYELLARESASVP
ncbi:hypothetical protein, partial [Streptomyces sp. NPDC007346]|uniref:hypothetical protein n=1 Tax=Streptomyces sp. NPDC007346 TaxID=3154682 RepID=UPI003456D81C